MVFAGVGFVSLPMDLMHAFVGRPRSTIPRSEYVTRAMALQARAVTIKVCGRIMGLMLYEVVAIQSAKGMQRDVLNSGRTALKAPCICTTHSCHVFAGPLQTDHTQRLLLRR
jgi:hypothetical protein